MNEFKVNDNVLHLPEGVCRITEVIERRLSSDGTRKYYILVPVYDPGTKIYFPIDGDVSKLRSLLTIDEINSLVSEIDDSETPDFDDEKKRQEAFLNILSRADRKELIMLITTLYEEKARKEEAGKKFHTTDERVVREAERIINEEFAFVLGIEPDKVPDYIRNVKKNSKK